MGEPCCATFKVMSLTPEETREQPSLANERAVAEWKPMVRWEEPIGAFVIDNTAIFFCPWCGASLPDKTEEALEEGRRKGIWIDYAAPNGPEASINGVPVDPENFLADLRRSTEYQD